VTLAGARRAYLVYLFEEAAGNFNFMMVVTAAGLFMIQVAKLDALQLVLVGTTLEASAFLFEVPTGVLADTVSRRLSVIVGTALIGVGLMVWGAWPLFGTILIGQVLWGIGFTFTSGATEAWISDETGNVGTGRIYLRAAQYGWAAGALGIVASVPLAAVWGLQAPILAGGLGYVLTAVVLVFAMPERHWSPTSRQGRSALGAMGDTLRRAAGTVRAVPALLTILAISFVAGAGSEAFDRLRELHILSNFALPSAPRLPAIAWFALINLVSLLASVAAVQVARRRIDTESHLGAARTLLILHVVLIGMIVAFAAAVSFEMAALSYLVTRIVRRVAQPIATAWINLGLTSDVRATVMSMNSQADALGQIAGGPLLGWLAVAAGSTRPAMLAVAAILTPSLYLYLRTIRLHGHDLQVESGSEDAT
jgi:DHA3 family tetracycline resistance protein-like MFS transporter